jgi:NADH dehydrogenase/NADH:ubiquinone oxidoreductase subunit G
MRTTKLLAALVCPLLLASFLQSQSLAELAKKEKERRAAMKGKATVITSADIAKVKKRPAVETIPDTVTTEGEVQAAEAAAGAPPEGTPPAAGEQVAEAAAEEPAPTPQEDQAAQAAKDLEKKQAELADLAQQKAEMVELLTLKLNALYQEFYGLENLKSRELLQIQISDTYDKLLKAETESAKAQKDLEDFLALSKKASAPEIWIK